MPVIALTSASGSPGVTTTALGWALSRGRPTVLVDADPTGGAAITTTGIITMTNTSVNQDPCKNAVLTLNLTSN